MRYDEFKKFFEARPFKPVRLFFTSGHPLDIRHPEQVIVARSLFMYAFIRKNGLLERTGWHSLIHVVKVVALGSLRRGKKRKQRSA
jgi:hypothetical protein